MSDVGIIDPKLHYRLILCAAKLTVDVTFYTNVWSNSKLKPNFVSYRQFDLRLNLNPEFILSFSL